MTCREAQQLLSAHIDGEVEATRAAEVEAHLGACFACREELAALRRTSRLLRALPAARLEVDLAPAAVARAAAPAWRERLAALRPALRLQSAFFVREFVRGAAIVAFFVLAAMSRERDAGSLVQCWSGRMVGAASTGVAEITAGLAQAQVFLGTRLLPPPLEKNPNTKYAPGSRSAPRPRPGPAAAPGAQEVNAHVVT